NVGFIRDVSIRLSTKTPESFVEQAAELIVRGGGIPFIFNDECFVPALTDRGIALEDARNYAPIGCIELTIPGKTIPHAVSGEFNALKCLELALFDGKDPRTGEQLGPRTGLLTDFAAYDQLYDAYAKQVEFFAQRMVYHCSRGELAQRDGGPLPCWSALTDDCIARGRDITDGGAIYNYHSVCLLGTPNTADALYAVKKLVFEEEAVDAAELLDALKADFDGCESLRKQLLTGAPKYGNDQEEVDAIARDVANHFIDVMDQARSALGARFFVHLFTFLWNIDFGRHTGATPDGRHAGDPLAYSLSAHQGRDQEGVTAMLQSLSRIPHHRAAGATAAIIDLDPKLVEGEAGIKRLVQIIRTAVGMGVGQLQFNVTTVERLLKAQQDPEHYGNLPVRVAGYSQKFNLLTKELQELVIARTKHAV
ncbi:MAG: glycyl radical protein, partial [bacterium]|nr:glycyl radical protein [bacterium]